MHFHLFHWALLWDNITGGENTTYIKPGGLKGFEVTREVPHPPFRLLEPWMKTNQELTANVSYIVYHDEPMILGSSCVMEADELEYDRVYCETIQDLEYIRDQHTVHFMMAIPRIKLQDLRSLVTKSVMRDVDVNVQGEIPNIMITDTGLDYYHCSFYDASRPVPTLGYFSSSLHSKLLGIVHGENADYIAVNGAHGTLTSAVASGRACGSFSGGYSPTSKLAFIDISIGDDYLTIPYHLKTYTETLYNLHNVRIHSMSWGDNDPVGGKYTTSAYIIDEMAYSMPELCMIAAAGNSGPIGRIVSPGNGKNVIGVGAEASFSSVGPTNDGRRGPSVIFEGVNVYTAYARYPQTTANHATFARASGTSLSAPAVAGLVAILYKNFTNIYHYVPYSCDIWSVIDSHAGVVDISPTDFHIGNFTVNSEVCLQISTPGTKRISFNWIDPPKLNFVSPLRNIYLVYINDVQVAQSPGNYIIFTTTLTGMVNLTVVGSLQNYERPSGQHSYLSMHMNAPATFCAQPEEVAIEESQVLDAQASIQSIVTSDAHTAPPPSPVLYVIIFIAVLIVM